MKPFIEFIAHRAAVASNRQTTLQLLVRILPPVGAIPNNSPLHLALAIDRSGSMEGRPLDHAKEAARLLVDRLRPQDKISVVTFDSEAQVVIPPDANLSKAEQKARIDSIQVGGYTNLHQGWLEACWQLTKLASVHGVKRTILLSDGQTNTGLCETAKICSQVEEWQSRGIGTSTVGLGLSYNEELLSRMAIAGGGNFCHAELPDALVEFFEVEFQSMGLTYGSDVGLHIEALNGVEVTRVYNPIQNRSDGAFRMTDLSIGYPKELVVELSVPPLARSRELCRVVLSYTDIEHRRRCRVSNSLALPVVSYGQFVEFPENVMVLQKRSLQMAARAMGVATKRISQSRPDEAQRVLKEALDILAETEQNLELRETTRMVEEMIRNLERREYEIVKKRGLERSTSMSYSSITLGGTPLSAWAKLPPSERTPERLKEMLEDQGWGSRAS